MLISAEVLADPFDIAVARQVAPDAFPERKLALVFRGGGMAAVHNAGAAEELDRTRYEPNGPSLLESANVIVGDSAGFVIAAGAIAGRAALGPHVFTENLPHQNFIGLQNILRRRGPFVRIEAVRENVEGCIDVDAIYDSAIDLRTVVTDLDTMSPVYLSTKDGSLPKDRFFDIMTAAISLPVVGGPPKIAELNGKPDAKLCDGGLLNVCSEKIAVEAGATDIISFSNHPLSEKWEVDPTRTALVALWTQRHGKAPRFGNLRAYYRFVKEQAEFMPTLADGSYAMESRVSLRVLYPDVPEELLDSMPGLMERDKQKLRTGYIVGRNTVRQALGLSLLPLPNEAEEPSRLASIAGKALESITEPETVPSLAF